MINLNLTSVWIGESDGKALYRIYNEKDLSTNQFRIPLGRMAVDKKTHETEVVWDHPCTHICH